MPCVSGPSYITVYDYSKQNAEMLSLADELTHALDVVREAILAGGIIDGDGRLYKLINKLSDDEFSDPRKWVAERSAGSVPRDDVLCKYLDSLCDEASEYLSHDFDMDEVYTRQVAHRKEDIKRLRLKFIEDGDEDNLMKTIEIDYSEPLEPQLGFDPDDF